MRGGSRCRIALEQRRRHARAVAHQAADGVDELQRRHRDAVAERGGGHRHLGPFLGRARPDHLGDLDLGLGVEADPPEEVLEHGRAAGGERHPRGADVGRVLEDLGHREPLVLGVVVADPVAADHQLAGGVEPVLEPDLAGVERRRDGQDLEHRAELVDLGEVAVEVLDPVGLAHPVRVEVRQAHHGEQLAGDEVEHHRIGADRAEAPVRVQQLLADDLLDAQIQAQSQRARRPASAAPAGSARCRPGRCRRC